MMVALAVLLSVNTAMKRSEPEIEMHTNCHAQSPCPQKVQVGELTNRDPARLKEITPIRVQGRQNFESEGVVFGLT